MTVCQKLGVILESKVVQKLSLEKKNVCKRKNFMSRKNVETRQSNKSHEKKDALLQVHS